MKFNKNEFTQKSRLNNCTYYFNTINNHSKKHLVSQGQKLALALALPIAENLNKLLKDAFSFFKFYSTYLLLLVCHLELLRMKNYKV